MRLAGPSAMKAVLPSLVIPMPTGWIASRRRPGMLKVTLPVTTRLPGSMTDTVPPISDDAHLDVAQADAPFDIDDSHRFVVLIGDVQDFAGRILGEQFRIGAGGQGVD